MKRAVELQLVILLLGREVQDLYQQVIFYVMDQRLAEQLTQPCIALLEQHMDLETGQLHLIYQI